MIDDCKVREQLSMADPHGVSEQVCDNNAVSSYKRVRRKIVDLPCMGQEGERWHLRLLCLFEESLDRLLRIVVTSTSNATTGSLDTPKVLLTIYGQD